MKDFVISDISVLLVASKRKQYRENVFLIFKSLARFLQENGLTTRPIWTTEKMSETFQIVRSDLTEEGFELFKKGVDQWTDGVEAGKWPPTDTTILTKYLIKIRTEKKA